MDEGVFLRPTWEHKYKLAAVYVAPWGGRIMRFSTSVFSWAHFIHRAFGAKT